jgi:hypothetical protein
VLVEGHILGRRGATSKGRVILEEVSFLLRRGALYGRWRVHGKGGRTLLLSFFLRRCALELSVHHHFGGRHERREFQQGKGKGKKEVKGTSKGKAKAKARGKRTKG